MIQQKFPLVDFARPLFGARVAMAWADPSAPMPRLIGDEVLAVELANAKRAREFGAGRAAARNAMEMLGYMPRPILQGDERAPIWPSPMTGSITHSDRDCLAVVTDDPDIAALGIDLEPATPLEPSLWPIVCTDAEMAWLASLGPSQRGHFAKLIFCIKEAVYKAQFNISRQMLDFHAVSLTLDLQRTEFLCHFTDAVDGFTPGVAFQGRFAILAGNFIAALELPSEKLACAA